MIMKRHILTGIITACFMTVAVSSMTAISCETWVFDSIEPETIMNNVDWDNIWVVAGGAKITFPATVSELFESGWTPEELAPAYMEELIDPLDCFYFIARKDGNTVYFRITNKSYEKKPFTECKVTGIDVLTQELTEPASLMHIKCQETTGDEIRELFGQEDLSYHNDCGANGESCTFFEYSDGGMKEILITVDGENGLVSGFSYTDMGMPEDMKAQAEDKPSEEILTYERAEGTGETFTDYRISLSGITYTLPIPVRVLIEDGWDAGQGIYEDIIAPGYGMFTDFTMDGRQIRVAVCNKDDKPAYAYNCWVMEISTDTFQFETEPEWELPVGIKYGMSRNKLEEVLASVGLSKTDWLDDDRSTYYIGSVGYDENEEESGWVNLTEEDDASMDYLEYVIYGNPSGKGYIVRMYSGDDENIPKDTVISGGVMNYPEEIYNNTHSNYMISNW